MAGNTDGSAPHCNGTGANQSATTAPDAYKTFGQAGGPGHTSQFAVAMRIGFVFLDLYR
jgi:hypothetical protein